MWAEPHFPRHTTSMLAHSHACGTWDRKWPSACTTHPRIPSSGTGCNLAVASLERPRSGSAITHHFDNAKCHLHQLHRCSTEPHACTTIYATPYGSRAACPHFGRKHVQHGKMQPEHCCAASSIGDCVRGCTGFYNIPRMTRKFLRCDSECAACSARWGMAGTHPQEQCKRTREPAPNTTRRQPLTAGTFSERARMTKTNLTRPPVCIGVSETKITDRCEFPRIDR